MDKRLWELIDGKSGSFITLNDEIWHNPETRFVEYRSAELQKKLLENEGFRITGNLSNLPTAFCAECGSGSPVVAVLGEFDALPGMSQQADKPERAPLRDGGPGHGCGHNTLGAAAVAAAVALKDYAAEKGLSGTIRYYGCPGEEGGGGKTFMVRDGYFKDVDAAVTWHPGSANCVLNSGFLANVKVMFDFHGTASHAAVSPELGRSALDAVELMNVGVNFLREHMIDDARIHYAITNAGGDAPNVVQAEAQVFYTIRAPKAGDVQELFERVKDIARGAALMTGTKVDIRVVAGYSDYIANPDLSGIMREHAKVSSGMVEYTEEDKAYAWEFQKTLNGQLRGGMQKLMNLDDSVFESPILEGLVPPPSKLPGSSDVGDVSWVVPMAQFMGNCYAFGTPAHSWQQVAQGTSSLAHKGLLNAARVMSATLADVLEAPEMVPGLKESHLKSRGGQEYACPITAETKPDIG